jgi:ppGpp synthetase/RelA/SpoT-type nucleotidyltranferase
LWRKRHRRDEVGSLVDGVTKLSGVTFQSRDDRQAENYRKMLVAMAQDIRVILIKLADRLHNMRTIGSMPKHKQQEKAKETLEIFAPLAHRLGIHAIKWELEDLAFATLHPRKYNEIKQLVSQQRDDREAYVARAGEYLGKELGAVGIEADISGRAKHFYSIYSKMTKKGREFNEIYDLTAMRVIVDSVKDCYGAIGVIHSLWKPLPGRFKDWVAMPKFNMYQALHTTVIGPEGRPLEIQIRTPEMHETAEYGIAAHVLYKEGARGKGDPERDKMTWLRHLLEEEGTARVSGLNLSDDELSELLAGMGQGFWGSDEDDRRAFFNSIAQKASSKTLERIMALTDDLDPRFDDVENDGLDDTDYEDLAGDLFIRGDDDNDIHPNDIDQQGLGDCYLLASLAEIAQQNPELIRDLVRPNDNGTFTVTFYDDGDPVEIVVGPHMPADDGSTVFANPAFIDRIAVALTGQHPIEMALIERQVVGMDQVGVGDGGAAVPRTVACRDRLEGVQRGADRGVADRVQVELEAGGVHRCGGVDQLGRFPVGDAVVAADGSIARAVEGQVGLEQVRGAALDHAVDEELDRGGRQRSAWDMVAPAPLGGGSGRRLTNP